MSNSIPHPFHLVHESPWPIVVSVFRFGVTIGFIKIFYFFSSNLVIISLGRLLLTSFQWWRDVRREGGLLGNHSYIVELGLRSGILLFIVSEIFFFLSFFWAYFHRRLRPNVELGRGWPPLGVTPFDPLGIPLLNRIILLSSGVSVTWAHHGLIKGAHRSRVKGLSFTIVLGVYFTALQSYEYIEARFRIGDRVFGSTFYIATGFHGLHVIVGTLFLMAAWLRLYLGNLSHGHHFIFEAASWYWHFVDVVWLFLYIRVYWWAA